MAQIARIAPTARRAAVIIGALVAILALSACGLEHRKNHNTVGDAENMYVNAGPLTYQVQLTRQLNPYATEDTQYLAGLSSPQTIPATKLWFAVFLWAKNQSGHPQTTSDRFEIVDSSGTTYQPVTLNPTLNPYAWTQQTLQPDGTEPAPDTTAADGPTQGGLILFKLDNSIYSNRPLTLEIFAPGQAKPTTVSLDL